MSMLERVTRIRSTRTRSITAENPDGRTAGGAQAAPGSDAHCTTAARDLGRSWKVRPCIRDLAPGSTTTIADVTGPGVVRHIWMTVDPERLRTIALTVTYDDAPGPSIAVPLGDFFANGIDGLALVNSEPICVNPRGGLNSYWPMPFAKRLRIDIVNDGPEPIHEFFYQVTWEDGELEAPPSYLHARWRRSLTPRESPEHVILDGATGPGHYVGTYLAWTQCSNGWWGEGEVKFFIDDDPDDAPTICGTGTEDYFGGAWGFTRDGERDSRPRTYSTPYLDYPQARYGGGQRTGPVVPAHGLYRWHVPDPVRFSRRLRVTVQALGWWPDRTYQPLTDDIASTALWYGEKPVVVGTVAPMRERWPR